MAVPKYVQLKEIQDRVLGKIQFTSDSEDENEMQLTLANSLIDEAEAEVELDLSIRYAVPFKGSLDGQTFKQLPTSTQLILKTLCRLQSVMKLIDTDFGRGSAVNGEEYKKELKARYDQMVEKRLLAKVGEMEDTNQWLYPPLEGLALAWGNQADDGYRGMVISDSPSNDGAYPRDQINDPSETFFGVAGWTVDK